MKNILSTALLAGTLLLANLASAQTSTDTNAPALPPQVGLIEDVGNFLAQGSNFIVVPYGILTTGNDGKYSAGGGVALGYKISRYMVSGIRMDYLNKAFYQGSFTSQLQVPIHVMTNFDLVPFVLGGVAMPFGGGATDPASVQGIAGTGLALRLDFLGSIGQHLDVIYDIEKWSATPGLQHRIGIGIKFQPWAQ